MSNYLLKTGQICERCLPEKDGGKRQEKDGSAEEKTPHRRWRYNYNWSSWLCNILNQFSGLVSLKA